MTNPRIAWFATVAMAVVSVTDVRADVSIATVGAFSGQVSFRGEQLRQGADMAVAHINAQGGVLGHKVSLLVEDDACDAGQAVAVANKLVKNGVVFVAGHNCSGASIPASKVYEAAGILMISPASTNPRFTDEGGPNVFRVCGRDDYQGVVAGDYLANHWGDKPIAILHDGQAYGKGLAEATKKFRHRNPSPDEMVQTPSYDGIERIRARVSGDRLGVSVATASLPTLQEELRETLLRLNAFARQATRVACHPKPKA